MADSPLLILIAPAVTGLLTYLQIKINLPRNKRYMQWYYPIAALVFSVAAALALGVYQKRIFSMLSLPQIAVNADVLLMNASIWIVFIMYKLVARPVKLRREIKAEKGLSSEYLDYFYNFNEDFSVWELQEKWVGMRTLLKVFVVLGATLIGFFFGILWKNALDDNYWTHMFPVIIQLVIIEIAGFLGGNTREELGNLIVGDESLSERVSSFYRMRSVYEYLLPEVLLSATTTLDDTYRRNTDFIEQLRTSGDDNDHITALYFDEIDVADNLNPDCMEATRALMRNENVMFVDPFYRDLSPYILLPIFRTLMSGKKVVVVAGRNSIREDITPWLRKELSRFTGTDTLWRIKNLNNKKPDCEIGVIVPSQMHDISVITANRKFLVDTGFVLMIEPSLLVNTGQIGMTVLSEEFGTNERPVICVIDRNVEGLVDTVSHIMHTEITNVVAPPLPRSVYSGMAWDADGDFKRQTLFSRETRYLGDGVELAAIAVRNQVSKVTWYGETKAPIRDIRWIAGQNYNAITKYMNLPAQQKSITDRIHFASNIWHCPPEKEQFIIAEDEFCNMFSTMKAYFSRGTDQTFVNVLSENYLLRDYMRFNPGILLSNPNAIPSIVPDYTRTERNTLYKLLLLMSVRPVSESELAKELSLMGYRSDDPLVPFDTLLRRYTDVTVKIVTVNSHVNDEEGGPEVEDTYEILEKDFISAFSRSLRSAYYVVEDEEYENNYIDVKLYGHVEQNVLPGQFVTYDGKYYRVKSVSPEGGVILRRAADLYSGRRYYRQIRKYTIGQGDGSGVNNIYDMDDIEIAVLSRDVSVETSGYLDMRSNNDLRTAKVIDFSKDESLGMFRRSYRNKEILRIRLRETDDRTRFTFCMILSEICRTLFPSAWQYIAVTTAKPDGIEGMLNHAIYSIDGDYNEDYIYIIEDSDIDLGLIGAIERNWNRIMEIITDYLSWHLEKMREVPVPVEAKESSISAVTETQEDEPGETGKEGNKETDKEKLQPEQKKQKRKGLIAQLIDNMINLFSKNKAKEAGSKSSNNSNSPGSVPEQNKLIETGAAKAENAEAEAAGAENPDTEKTVSEAAEAGTVETEAAEAGAVETAAAEAGNAGPEIADSGKAAAEDPETAGDAAVPGITDMDGTDVFEAGGNMEDDDFYEGKFRELGLSEAEPTRYQRECYLKYGFDGIDNRLQLDELRKYLTARGWSDNALRRAREAADPEAALVELEGIGHCDFCGKPLTGVSYELLSDGRIRCDECSSTAITSESEFKELFLKVMRSMEGFYGIDFRRPITAWMTDSKTLARTQGAIFKPTDGFDARTLGYAVQKQDGSLGLVVENGSPRLATIATIAHELTHIWQYINWNDADMKRLYPDPRIRLAVYEGMAKWAEIQYLYIIGETTYARQQEFIESHRDDEYGLGLRSYLEEYPFIKDGSLVRNSPFKMFPPL